MVAIKWGVLTVLFLVELAALFSFGYWGFHIKGGWVARAALGIGTPLAVAIIWGLFVAPKASYPVALPVKLLLQIAVFALAALALHFAGRSNWAIVYGLTALIDLILVYMMKL